MMTPDVYNFVLPKFRVNIYICETVYDGDGIGFQINVHICIFKDQGQ